MQEIEVGLPFAAGRLLAQATVFALRLLQHFNRPRRLL
jgi:hypothetical protein